MDRRNHAENPQSAREGGLQRATLPAQPEKNPTVRKRPLPRTPPGKVILGRPSGTGGAPGATRGGVVSKSATKAPRAGIGRGGNRGISTILLARPDSMGAFVADLDTDRVRTGSGPGPTGPTRPAHPTCLRFRFSPPLPGPNMAPREDRSGAHPTARPSEPRNHAETDGHTRGGGPNDPPRAPESGPGPGPRSPPTPPRSARATDSDTPRPTSPIRPTQTHPE